MADAVANSSTLGGSPCRMQPRLALLVTGKVHGHLAWFGGQSLRAGEGYLSACRMTSVKATGLAVDIGGVVLVCPV